MIPSNPLDWASYKMERPTYASLSRVFDTFRILHEAMDFSDLRGSGWRILRTLLSLARLKGGRDLEAGAALVLGLIKLSSFELKTYGVGHRFAGILGLCIHPVSDESCDLLLHIGGQDLINYPIQSNIPIKDGSEGYPLLHWCLMDNKIGERLNRVLSKGPDLFRSSFNGVASPRKETPTSLAMYSSWAFESWRDGLISVGVDIENFVKQELEKNQLVHTGWITPTLLQLFLCDHSEYKLTQKLLGCSSCASMLRSIHVQPHWRHRLERIRQGLDPDLPVQDSFEANDTELTGLAIYNDTIGSQCELADETYGIEDGALDSDTQFSSGPDSDLGQQRNLFAGGDPHGYPRTVSLLANCVFDKHEYICMSCWLHYVRTGTRRKVGRWKRGYPPWAISYSSSADSFSSEDESLDSEVSEIGSTEEAESEDESLEPEVVDVWSSEDEASEDEFSPYLIHT